MQRSLLAAALAVALSSGPAAYAQTASPLGGLPGLGGIGGKMPIVGGFFGGDEATRSMQLLQQAEALLQTKAQLEMLMALGINNAPEVSAALTRIRGLLGQIEGVLGYDPASVVGQIEARYPMEYRRPVDLPEAIARQKEWDAARYAALSESHRLQSQVMEELPMAADRDAALMDQATASPGLRASQDTGNQLTLVVAEELRKLQMLEAASMRAAEARQLEEAAQRPLADASFCGFMQSSAGSEFKSRACNGSN